MLNLLGAVSDVTQFASPGGIWPSIINGIFKWGIGYGATIILLTLFIKLAMAPMDFWQKYVQKLSMFQQKRIKPELDAIKKRYGYDKNMLNAKTQELYKKHKINPMGSCLPMLITMGVTLAVFITLISSISSMGTYMMRSQYSQLSGVYKTAYMQQMDTDMEFMEFVRYRPTNDALEVNMTLPEPPAPDPNDPPVELEHEFWFVTMDGIGHSSDGTTTSKYIITDEEGEDKTTDRLLARVEEFVWDGRTLDYWTDNSNEKYDALTAEEKQQYDEAKQEYDDAVLARETLRDDFYAWFALDFAAYQADADFEVFMRQLLKIEEGQPIDLSSIDGHDVMLYWHELGITAGQDAVSDAWSSGKIRERFLWIRNIWRSDTNQKPIAQYQDIDAGNYDKKAGDVKLDGDGNIKSSFYSVVTEEDYNMVMSVLLEGDANKGSNGYYILTILAVLTTGLSSWLTSKKNKGMSPIDVAGGTQGKSKSGRMMMLIMPVIMGVFTLTASSPFAIYLVISQLLSIATIFAFDPIVNKLIKRKEKKVDEGKPTINYSR